MSRPIPIKVLRVVLLVLCGVLGILLWRCFKTFSDQKQTLDAMRENNARLEKRAKELLAVLPRDVPARSRSYNEERERLLALAKTLPSDGSKAPSGPPVPEGPGGDVFPELMGDPVYNAAVKRLWQSSFDYQYARFVRWQHLPVETGVKLADLLNERHLTMSESAYLSGKTTQDESTVRDAARRAWESFTPEIIKLIGEEGYKRLEAYERADQSGPGKALDSIEARLSYTDSPLTDAQAEELYYLGITCGVSRLGSGSRLPDSYTAGVEKVLSPAQMPSFRDYVTYHQATLAQRAAMKLLSSKASK